MQVLHHVVPESPVQHLIHRTIEVQFSRLSSFLYGLQTGHLMATEPNEQGEGKRTPSLCTSIRAILVGKPASTHQLSTVEYTPSSAQANPLQMTLVLS